MCCEFVYSRVYGYYLVINNILRLNTVEVNRFRKIREIAKNRDNVGRISRFVVKPDV